MKQISIPEPCSQRWDSMLPVDHGRHCARCCKAVTDLTIMTDQQIIDHITTKGTLCGRIDELQMASVNRVLAREQPSVFGWKKFGLAASLLLTLPGVSAYAQHKVASHRPVHKKLAVKQVIFKTICGTVRDTADRSPLPGVIINVKGTTINAATDINGNYTINVPEHADTLAVSFMGYQTREMVLAANSNVMDVALTSNDKVRIIGYGTRTITTLTGAIAVVVTKRPSFFRRMYDHLIKQPVKKIFG